MMTFMRDSSFTQRDVDDRKQGQTCTTLSVSHMRKQSVQVVNHSQKKKKKTEGNTYFSASDKDLSGLINLLHSSSLFKQGSLAAAHNTIN